MLSGDEERELRDEERDRLEDLRELGLEERALRDDWLLLLALLLGRLLESSRVVWLPSSPSSSDSSTAWTKI